MNENILFQFGKTSNYLPLNTALICPSSNLEKSHLSPIIIPWISNFPIRNLILNSPSHNLYWMPSKLLSSYIMIDSWFISKKIGVYSKHSLHWAVIHDLILDLWDHWANSINTFCKPFVIQIILSIYTIFTAIWCPSGVSTQRVFSSSMMITRRKRIRLTVLSCIEQPTCYNSCIFEPCPCCRRVASITAFSTVCSTTSQQILSRNPWIVSLIWSNTNSVSKNLNSSECPAWTTDGLISNLSYGGAVRPLYWRKELCWYIF